MHTHDLSLWRHSHDFGTQAERSAERRTRWVVGITFVAMVVELMAGWLTGSMALLADGWHMASHVGALGMAAFAYRFARQHAGDGRFTFGTGKVTALAGYTSALGLSLVALWMVVESAQRLYQPVTIHYAEAMGVALLGLAVNLASAWLLDHDHGHRHGHAHDHDDHGDHEHHHPTHGHEQGHEHAHADDHDHHHHEHVDHNLKAAYLHVLADALTSVLAIVALAGGMVYGWSFLDPIMGIVGVAVVGRWAVGLARDSARVLLDAEDHGRTEAEVRRIIATQPDLEIADLHLWRVGPASRACILSLVTHAPKPVDDYRRLLAGVDGLDHLTVEINHCRGAACPVAG